MIHCTFLVFLQIPILSELYISCTFLPFLQTTEILHINVNVLVHVLERPHPKIDPLLQA